MRKAEKCRTFFTYDLDELFEDYEQEKVWRLAYKIADNLAVATAERFSEMLDGTDMDTAKQIVRRLEESDAEAVAVMLQEMFLIKGMAYAAENLDILRDIEEFDETIYWRFG